MNFMKVLLPAFLSLFLFAACGDNVAKQDTDHTYTIATRNDPVIPITQPATAPTPTVSPATAPTQAAPKARVDFKSAEHIAASKDRLAKTYPDSFATQKTLLEAAIKDQAELETLVNSLPDNEWSSLQGPFNRLVKTYSNQPSTVLTLFQEEIKAFRSMK